MTDDNLTYVTADGARVEYSRSWLTGTPGWTCQECATRFIYVEDDADLEHACAP